MRQQFDVFEEYDGLNHEDAQGLLLVVTLPLLTRGHAIQCHVLHDEHIMVQVPNIYNLLLGLPIKVETETIKTFFDCKIRRLFVHAVKRPDSKVWLQEHEDLQDQVQEKPVMETKVEETNTDEVEEEVEEIDTDAYFERGSTGKLQS